MTNNQLEELLDTLLKIEQTESAESGDLYIVNWLKNYRPRFLETRYQQNLSSDLQAWLNQHDADPYALKQPYYHFFLALSHYIKLDKSKAESAARISEREFINRGKQLQGVISGWFLGLLWFETGQAEAAMEKFHRISQMFAKRQHYALARGFYDRDNREIEEKINRSFIEAREAYENQEPQREKDKTPPPEKSKKSTGAKDASLVKTAPGNDNGLFYITIPVDGHKLEDPAFIKQIKTAIAGKTSAEKENKETKTPPPEPAYESTSEAIWIPAIDLYENVSAGPGEAHLQDTGGKLGPILSDHILTIDGKEYKVKLRVGKIDEKALNRYGWARVSGVSMNSAKDGPINDGDFVLFRSINNFENHVGRVVVGELIDDITQPVQVVVKRLVKADTFYLLHSESTEYKADIRVERDNQVRGVVIGVAKPI